MTVEEIQQDTKTVEQIVDDMDLYDDDLMSMVFDGNIEATELLLKVILKRDDIIVISAIGRLMHDFGCKESKDIYYPELAKGVKHFKEEEGGRKIMGEAVEKYAEKKLENARLNNLLDSIRKIMTNMKMGAEQAMNVLEVDDNDRAILQERL